MTEVAAVAAAVVDQATVLFVDDEPSILSALRRLFRPEGYRVLMAESGASALSMLENESIDLVVSDMRMPEMDGAQFLEQVRLRWSEVVRILLTGYADIGSTIDAINRGEIHRYIAKPWDDQDLLLVVRQGLSRRRLEQENKQLQALTAEQNAALQKANAQLERKVDARTQEVKHINLFLESTYQELETQFMVSLDVFAGLLELRSGGSAGYSRQVAGLGKRIAEKLGLDERSCKDVYVAGLLHEIGKIGLPDALLMKPMSAMTNDDIGRFKKHCLAAEAALMPLDRLHRAARIVRRQNERVDGRGFPDAISAPAFTPADQALAAAAFYHALLSGRLSERRHSGAEAASLISQSINMRFDEAVVQAFQMVLADIPVEQVKDHLITANDLRAGMILARDLMGPQGTLLLATGYKFDERVVKQIREMVEREHLKLVLYVMPEDEAKKAAAGH